MRLAFALAVAVVIAVTVGYAGMAVALQIDPPHCAPAHGPGAHTLECIVDLRPQLTAAVVTTLLAGALGFVLARRLVR